MRVHTCRGIAAEQLHVALRTRTQVYQLHGGIMRSVEAFPDGKFEGTNLVFDGRGAIRPAGAQIVGQCDILRMGSFKGTLLLLSLKDTLEHSFCCTRLADWQAGWLVGWLTGWLVGQTQQSSPKAR